MVDPAVVNRVALTCCPIRYGAVSKGTHEDAAIYNSLLYESFELAAARGSRRVSTRFWAAVWGERLPAHATLHSVTVHSLKSLMIFVSVQAVAGRRIVARAEETSVTKVRVAFLFTR